MALTLTLPLSLLWLHSMGARSGAASRDQRTFCMCACVRVHVCVCVLIPRNNLPFNAPRKAK